MRDGAEARNGFAHSAVAFSDEQRQPQHAAPGFPDRGDIVAVGRRIKRHAERVVIVIEREGDGGRLIAIGRNEAQRDAPERRNRQSELHAHAAHGTPQHHVFAMKFHLAHLPVRPESCAG